MPSGVLQFTPWTTTAKMVESGLTIIRKVRTEMATDSGAKSACFEKVNIGHLELAARLGVLMSCLELFVCRVIRHELTVYVHLT